MISLLLLLASTLSPVKATFTPPEFLNIGVIHSTTCPTPCTLGESGYALHSIARMAAAKINADPNLLPNTTIVLKHYDTLGDAGTATMEGARAMLEGADGLLGGFHSSCSKPIGTVSSYMRIPQISAGSTNSQLSDKSTYDHFMRVVAPDANMVPAMARAIQDLGWTKVATLCTQDDFASQAINAFETSAMAIGLEIVTSAEFPFPGTAETAKSAMKQIKDSGAKVVVAFLTAGDFHLAFQGASDLGMTDGNAVQWVINTAEFNYPSANDQDELYNSVIKGLIGVQPYLGGGAVYDEYNAYWRSLDVCDTAGCDDPLDGRGGDLSKYTLADYDLANILYGSYQVDGVLAYAHAAHSLFEEGKTICQNLNDNPCVTSANGLSVEYDESCVATTPCTTALKDRLFSLTSQNVAGLTGSLHFENVTKDRIVTYEVRNWRAHDDGAAKYLSQYNTETQSFEPTLFSLLQDEEILFNTGQTQRPDDVEDNTAAYLQFIIIPIGAVLATGIAFCVAMRTENTVETLMKMMKRTFILIVSLAFELTDIVSDIIVLFVIINTDDEDLKDRLLVWYCFFIGAGFVVFAGHVLVNAIYLIRLFNHATQENYALLKTQVVKREKKLKATRLKTRKSSGRKISPKESDREKAAEEEAEKTLQRAQGSTVFEKKLRFVECAHECNVAESQMNRIIALFGLLIIEDIPMGVLNIMLITEGGCDETGGVRTIVLFSLIVSTLMIAFKLSQVSGLGEAQRILDVQHRSCVRLLEDLGEDKK